MRDTLMKIRAIVSLSALAALLAPASARAAEPARTLTVDRGSVVRELVEAGEVKAIRSREVNAPMEWRMDLQVVRLHGEGVVVAESDTLVQLDTSTLEQELKEAENELAGQRAELRRVEAEQAQRRRRLENQLAQADFQAEQATIQLEKLEFESESKRHEQRLELKKAGVARAEAQAKLRAQTTLDSLELARTNLQIAEARSRVEAERTQIASMTLVAPIDGFVVHGSIDGEGRKIREGDVVGPAQAIILLPDLTAMEAIIEINEVDRGRVHVGQKARISLDAYPMLDLPGEVTGVARLALPPRDDSAVRVFSVDVRIDGTDARLKPGMTAQVRLAVDRRDDVLRVPRGALRLAPDGSSVVFPAARWPDPRTVETGLIDPRWIEARGGVSEGEVLSLDAPPDGDFAPWQAARNGGAAQ